MSPPRRRDLVLWAAGIALFAVPFGPVMSLFGVLPTQLAIYGGLAALALAILRGRIGLLLRSQPDAVHGAAAYRWSWARAWVAVLAGGGLLLLPVAWGIATEAGLGVRRPGPEILGVLALQVLVVGLVEEIFFREAALRALGPNSFAVAAASLPCFAAIHWQSGPLAMGIALSVGMVYLAARLAGAPVLALGLVHGLVNVVSARVLVLPIRDPQAYVLWLMPASAVLALFILWLGRDRP